MQPGATITLAMGLASPNMPTIVSTPVRQPDSPSPPAILLDELDVAGSETVNLSSVHDLPDMSSLDLLAVAAPTGMDSVCWGDESILVPTPVRQARAGKLVDVPTPQAVVPARPGTGPAMAIATPSKVLSGTERLKFKMAELNRKKAAQVVPHSTVPSDLIRPAPASLAGPCATRTPIKAPLRPRTSIAAPGHTRRQSLAGPPSAAKPRPSMMPTSKSTGRLSMLAGPAAAASTSVTPATPGRSQATRERLERAREERARREGQRSPEKRRVGEGVARPIAMMGAPAAGPSSALARPRTAVRTAAVDMERKATGTGLTRGVFKPTVPAPRVAAVAAAPSSGLTRTSSLSRLPTTARQSAAGRPALTRASTTSGASVLSASANGLRPAAARPSATAPAPRDHLASLTKPRPSTGLPAPRARPSIGVLAGNAGLGITGVRMGAGSGERGVGRGQLVFERVQ